MKRRVRRFLVGCYCDELESGAAYEAHEMDGFSRRTIYIHAISHIRVSQLECQKASFPTQGSL